MSDAATLEPVGKREKTKAANRQAILDAARAVFAQLGYEAATVRDIIRGTDLASGTFYNYFKSKEEVYEALADDGARRFRPILRLSRENAKSFEDYLHSAFVAYFQFILADNSAEGRPIDERRPHVLRMDTPEMVAVYQEVRQSLEEAIARGDAPHVDADYLACACIGMAQEVGGEMLRRNPRDVDAAARFVTGLLLNGLPGAAKTS
jgi:AcrR family transcriptional regulator